MPFGRIAGLTPVIGAARPFVAVDLGARGSVEVGAGLLLAETVVFGLTVVLAAAPAFDGGLAFDDGVNVPVLALGPEFDTLARLAAVAALMLAAAPVLQDVAALTLALATVLGSIDILPLPTPGFALELVRVAMVDAATGEAVFVGGAVSEGDVALRDVMERLPTVTLPADANVDALFISAVFVPEASELPAEMVVFQGLCLVEDDGLTLIVPSLSFSPSLPRVVA